MAQNTEKPTGKDEMKKQIVNAPIVNKADLEKAPVEKIKVEEKKTEEAKVETKPKTDIKKKVKPAKKTKKTEVAVNATSIPMSTKYAASICKFIKYKTIGKAIADLEEVIAKKKAVPMKGEIPHRKGRIMSGRFPKRASENFIVLLKSLKGNATNHDVEDPIIVEAIANLAQRPRGRFGAVRKKRSHVRIVAKEKKLLKKTKKKKTGGKKVKKRSSTQSLRIKK